MKDQFDCAPRGLVEVKAFGKVQTYVIARCSLRELAEQRGHHHFYTALIGVDRRISRQALPRGFVTIWS